MILGISDTTAKSVVTDLSKALCSDDGKYNRIVRSKVLESQKKQVRKDINEIIDNFFPEPNGESDEK